jgi:hypothetical protein
LDKDTGKVPHKPWLASSSLDHNADQDTGSLPFHSRARPNGLVSTEPSLHKSSSQAGISRRPCRPAREDSFIVPIEVRMSRYGSIGARRDSIPAPTGPGGSSRPISTYFLLSFAQPPYLGASIDSSLVCSALLPTSVCLVLSVKLPRGCSPLRSLSLLFPSS